MGFADPSLPATALPDVPFSARDFKLKMARDIMTLPASDRSEVIGFLLGGLLGSNGSSPELKRAVIDTLEHLHSAALVNVLLDCLDDPDPIVQDYALAAADRLLGTTSGQPRAPAPATPRAQVPAQAPARPRGWRRTRHSCIYC